MNAAFLLRAALLAAIAPALPACGGTTPLDTSTTGAAGDGGSGGSNGGSGGSNGGSGGSNGGSGGATIVPGDPCLDPQPIVVKGQPTGVDHCADGNVHAREKLTCPSAIPTDFKCPLPGSGGCATDADCQDKPNGHCTGGVGNAISCFCQYGCTQDAECGAGEVCLCGDPVGTCTLAGCKSDADCAGFACTSFSLEAPCNPVVLACRSPQDTCTTGADCDQTMGLKGCSPPQDSTGEGPWSCKHQGLCTSGRPLLILGHSVRSSLLSTRAWS